MTDIFNISETIPHINFVGDGTQTEFCFPFLIFEAGNISVFLNGETVSSGYTVEFSPNITGGKVIFETAPANGTKVSLVRELTIRRVSDFQEGSEIRSKVLNHEFNYQMACSQQIADALNRALVAPPYATAEFSTALPEPVANKALVWNQQGNALSNSSFDIAEIESNFNSTLANVDTKYNHIISMENQVLTKAAAVSSAADKVAADKTAAATYLNQFEHSVRLPIHTVLYKHGKHNIVGTELLDGHIVNKDKYPQFWQDIVSFKQKAVAGDANYALYNYTEDSFDLEVTDNGSCLGFVIDETAGTVRLPYVKADQRFAYMVCANTVQDVAMEEISSLHDEIDVIRSGNFFNDISEANARKIPGNRIFYCSPHIYTPELSSVLNFIHNLNLDTKEKIMACQVSLYAICLGDDNGYTLGEVVEVFTQDLYRGSFWKPWILQKNNLFLLSSNGQWLIPSKDNSNPYWNSINGSQKWKFVPVIHY